MKLAEYKKKLDQFIATFPEALKLEVYTASDDEGNSYNEVLYAPSIQSKKDLGLPGKGKVTILN